MEYLLHIDTATDTGTVAIAGDGSVLAYRTNNEMRNHASTINNMIKEVIAAVNKSLDDVSGIVVCGGPGSYTGLRIGMATAKGLCYALNKPLFADNRLTLMAYKAWQQHGTYFDNYISLIKAREKEYFISIYNNQFTCLQTAQHITEDELSGILGKTTNAHIISDVSADTINSMNINNLSIDTDISTHLEPWAAYAFEQYKCNRDVNLAAAEPFYLKQVYTHK